MRFLADMGVSIGVAEWLRRQGHVCTHLRDEGLQRIPNGEIFAKAASESRVVLTFDLDFGEIAALTAGRKGSVIVFRLRNTRTSHVVERLAGPGRFSRGAGAGRCDRCGRQPPSGEKNAHRQGLTRVFAN